ncbi:MAG: radical SAM protein [Planctomycetota bacterium]|nr:radical SAM protein [Planctomycetota bacterium]
MTTLETPREALQRRPNFDPRLLDIADKVRDGVRLSFEDGMTLYETPDIWTLGGMAHEVRMRMHGEIAYYNVNRHINYSNVCALSCTFCAFYRKKDQEGAYEFSIEQIKEEAIKAASGGATELHIVGGLHPWLPFDYYTDMMLAIREVAPQLHIKAFTAVEIVHLARISKRGKDGVEGYRAVLSELKEAGLGSLPGGGAEVFDDRVHDEAFKGKIKAFQWLDVHRAAHELGLNTNATMLYGHVESRAERIGHMLILREQQDATLRDWAADQGIALQQATKHDGDQGDAVVLYGNDDAYPNERLPMPEHAGGNGYYQTIIPLPFFPDKSELEHLPAPTGLENLRTLAISRLMLDNFPHVKAFWIMQSLEMAQVMLQNGADDIDGTVVWYDITKLISSDEDDPTHQEVGVFELQKAIRDAGFEPVERDTLYRKVVRQSDEPTDWRVLD